MIKFKDLAIIGVAATSFGIGFAVQQTTAQASYFIHYPSHGYTPRSWRGTYYNSYGATMNVNTYSIEQDGETVYKNTWSGWRKLSFARIAPGNAITKKHKIYTFNSLAKYGYQSSRQWRLTTKNGKKELIHYSTMGTVIVWHKYYAPKKVTFRTADNTDFYYNAWRPAYLDMFTDSTDLYGSYDDAKNEENSIGTFSNPRKQISAKWLSEDQQTDILELKIDGKTYYADNTYHDIRPYSAHRDKDSIWSSFKPTSKYARLKKGNHVYVGTEWTYFYNKDNETTPISTMARTGNLNIRFFVRSRNAKHFEIDSIVGMISRFNM